MELAYREVGIGLSLGFSVELIDSLGKTNFVTNSKITEKVNCAEYSQMRIGLYTRNSPTNPNLIANSV